MTCGSSFASMFMAGLFTPGSFVDIEGQHRRFGGHFAALAQFAHLVGLLVGQRPNAVRHLIGHVGKLHALDFHAALAAFQRDEAGRDRAVLKDHHEVFVHGSYLSACPGRRPSRALPSPQENAPAGAQT
ncbi:hypothetical protein E5E91_01360 [Deinococcus radiodurans R1 = ATCC 13939 = DSM 20539]|uniref:Uncharacterized protein n=1 Tax=Deinococcus radiodurans (strain ATCC 13939 / DSM 20539 / JCM 16871 / CCUG 27074 / LMG 4051 / NBRC 15346 / NCIMB 9279 / VKM B-1422 / R1) TaxID=243230 RepID=Q9RXP6_DEIRA|nr:hypothetical protein DR_0263 [Deinococcus radiodurans R1 = ATCC 13939 = DSM 20539]QEM72226.1 hypothetical protein DXG80_10955 [Deinococcus radiodurans]UDK99460.1 hypothetical protein E5E91_01360 [Deinococcus radiodurans R1 = ATCC 13939 = DSM 20539]HCE64716.1 hypothetical protein [Deinococcus radiodurans]